MFLCEDVDCLLRPRKFSALLRHPSQQWRLFLPPTVFHRHIEEVALLSYALQCDCRRDFALFRAPTVKPPVFPRFSSEDSSKSCSRFKQPFATTDLEELVEEISIEDKDVMSSNEDIDSMSVFSAKLYLGWVSPRGEYPIVRFTIIWVKVWWGGQASSGNTKQNFTVGFGNNK